MGNHALVKYLCCVGKKEKGVGGENVRREKNDSRIIEVQDGLRKIKALLKCFIQKSFSYLFLLTGYLVNQIFWGSLSDFLPLQMRCLMFDF